MQGQAAAPPEAGGNAQALSRRTALLVLAGGLTCVGAFPPSGGAGLPADAIVVVDGWILRADDLGGVRRGAG